MLELHLVSDGGIANVNGFNLQLTGNVPAGQAQAAVWQDDGDGVWTLSDTLLDSRAFMVVPAVPPSANFSFGNVNLASPGTTFFFTLSYTGFPPATTWSVGFDQPYQIFLGANNLVPGSIPAFSSPTVVSVKVFADPANASSPYPTPRSGPVAGGLDTGFRAEFGQTVSINTVGISTWGGGAGTGVQYATGSLTTGGVGGFRLGSLMGRVGGGNWFQVGVSTSFVASNGGILYLAMNDADYTDGNAGFQTVVTSITPSVLPKRWLGGTLGFETLASVDSNWAGGRPHDGEKILVDNASWDLDWDLSGIQLAGVTISTAFHHNFTMQPGFGGFTNTLNVSTHVLIGGGTFYLNRQTLQSRATVYIQTGAFFDMGSPSGAVGFGYPQIAVQDALVVSSSGVFRSATGGNVYALDFNKGFDFIVTGATVTVGSTAGGGQLFLSGVRTASIGPGLHLGQFDDVFINAGSNSPNGWLKLNSAPGDGPFSFARWNISGPGSIGIDATGSNGVTYTFAAANGGLFGSPHTTDPNATIVWSPDGGGTQGQISGTLACLGPSCVGGAAAAGYAVYATTIPSGAFIYNSAYCQTNVNPGNGYTISNLPAPNTYYVFAVQGLNCNPSDDVFAIGQAARGGYQHGGFLRSDPIFLGSNGNIPGVNVNVASWASVSGSVDLSGTPQVGPVIVQAWKGTPGVATSTRAASGPGPFFSFDAPAGPEMLAFVDINGNGAFDPAFESSGVVPVSVASGSFSSGTVIAVTGGSAAPGGLVTLSTQAISGGAIADSNFSPMIRLDLAAAGGAASVGALRLAYTGSFSPMGGGVMLQAVEDVDNDGVFTPPLATAFGPGTGDRYLGSFFATPSASSGTLFFYQPLQIPSGQVRHMLVGVDPIGNKIPTATLAVTTSGAFGMSAGSMASQPGLYPSSTTAAVKLSVPANYFAFAFGQGGRPANTRVFAGQAITTFTASGQWRVDGSAPFTGLAGQLGTQNQNTVFPQARLGELIGLVQNCDSGCFSSGWFRVGGATLPIQIPTNGDLYLAMNDYENAYADNQGAILFDFAVSGSTLGALTGAVHYSTPVAGTMTFNVRLNQVTTVMTATAAVTTNVYSYPFSFPGLVPGRYDVYATNDANTDRSFTEPLEVRAGQTTNMNPEMYSGNSGQIGGDVSYSGVLPYGDFRVGVATDVNVQSGDVFFFGQSNVGTTPGAFNVPGLPSPATYYVVAYRDGNYDNQPDGPEPFGYHGTPGGHVGALQGFLQPVWLSAGGSSFSIHIALQDTGGIEGNAQLPATPAGAIIVQAGIGVFGTPGFVSAGKTRVPLPPGLTAAPAFHYELGLLAPASNYSLFAFLDSNDNGVLDAGEPSAQTAADIAVPQGQRAHRDVSLTSVQPPAAPSVFNAQAVSAGVFFQWNLVPGATSYQLRTASNAVYANVTTPGASVYLDALPANTSSAITAITASGGNGVSAATPLPATVWTAAAVPNALAVGSLTSVSASVTWGANGNPGPTVYEVWRATQAAGSIPARVWSGTGLSFSDRSLAQGVTYGYTVRANNGNGVATGFTSQSLGAASGAATGLGGLVFYNGSQSGNVVVEAFTNSTFTLLASSVSLPSMSVQPWYLPVGAGSFYVRAWKDVLGNGVKQAFADAGVASNPVAAPAPSGVNFALSVDTITPAPPAGLTATPSLRSVQLVWAAPTKNANGTPLLDLAGYQVRVSTNLGATFATFTTTSTRFTVTLPPSSAAASVVRSQVLAQDYAGNLSLPTAFIDASPSLGGSISGALNVVAVPTGAQFRVRLATAPAPTTTPFAEATVTTYTFTGLPDGVYYLSAYRDDNGNGAPDPRFEPTGTFGGFVTPFPIRIVNGNAVSNANATVCDRVPVAPGAALTVPAFTAADCPALDKGTGFQTKLYSLPVGDGQPGSFGLGSVVSASLKAAFDTELIVLGPDGSVVARDNTPGGAGLTFTANAAGTYLLEPTRFTQGAASTMTLSVRVDGGYAGSLSGATSGGHAGKVFVQAFGSSSPDAPPLFTSTTAAVGAYSFTGLRDGLYFLRSFQDVNGNGVRDPSEPYGVFGAAVSSPTPVSIVAGSNYPPAPYNIALADPAVGSILGTVIYRGSQAGAIRVEAGTASCPFCTGINQVLATASTGTAGQFALDFLPPATNYVVRAYMDLNANGTPDSLEPLISSVGVSVVANSTRTVGFILDDPGTSGAQGSAVITGTVTYNGASHGTVFVGFSRDPGFNRIDYLLQLPVTGYFQRSGIMGNATYYMAGFIDVNGNNTPDPAEPTGVGALTSAGAGPFDFSNPPAIPLSDWFGTTTTLLTLTDPPDGQIQGVISYSGSASGATFIVQAPRPFQHGQKTPTARVTRTGAQTSYTLGLLAAATDYDLNVFLDSNGNGQPDPGEPIGGRHAITVSSGTGALPTYGQDVTLFDPGAGGFASTDGSVLFEATYLGVQSGPVFFRLFDNADLAGVPVVTASQSGPAGPGDFTATKTGVPPGEYWGDAFRDPSGAGVYVPALHAHGLLAKGRPIFVQSFGGFQNAHAELSDPGQGGSVNAFTGSFASPAGARFDGGATDVLAMVVVDSYTAGAPQPVVIGVSNQNQGDVGMLARFSNAGAMVSTGPAVSLDPDSDGVRRMAIDMASKLYSIDELNSFGGYSTATIKTYSPTLGYAGDVQFPSLDHFGDIAFSTTSGRLYAAGEGRGSTSFFRIVKVSPSSWVTVATGTYTPPQLCGSGYNCSVNVHAIATTPDDSAVWVWGTEDGPNGQSDRGLDFLMKFNSGLSLISAKDVTSLNLPHHGGVQLASAIDGGVYAAGVRAGDTVATTYRFDASLNQVSSTTFGPVLIRFNGGMGNVATDPQDGSVYQTWESTGRGGDITVLRYDKNLNLLARQDIDGGDGTREDFSFSLSVYNSSQVFVAGSVNNGRNLDWAVFRVNMNASGSVLAPGAGVAITTSNAVNYVFGSLSYAGTQATSGQVRATLTPAGSQVPSRISTAPFGASASYLFNNVPYGQYGVTAFIDRDGDLKAGGSEPVAWPAQFGYFFGSSLTVPTAELCDRALVTLSTVVTGSLGAGDCHAWDRGGPFQKLYAFAGTRGQPLTIQMDGVTLYDTFVRLYDADGNALTEDDNSAGSGNALISNYVLPRSGLYTVAASAWPGATGSYRLTLSGSAGSLGAIAGSVQYSGLQGGTIRVAAARSPSFSTATIVAFQALVSTRQFTFSNLPTGTTYYLGAFVDVNNNGNLDSGEDSGAFGANGVPDPLLLQQGQDLSGVTIQIAPSTASLASAAFLTGITTYTGTQSGSVMIEFWSNAQFTGRPVATRVVPSTGPWDAAVPGGQSYYIRAYIDSTPNFAPDPSEPRGVYVRPGQTAAEPVFAPTGQTLLGLDVALKDPGVTAGGAIAGEGTAVVTPSSVPAGKQFSVSIVYTAGPNGLQSGGQVGFTAPTGYQFPFNSPTGSSVTATSSAGAILGAVVYNGPSASVPLTGALNPGQTVTLQWTNVFAPCPGGAGAGVGAGAAFAAGGFAQSISTLTVTSVSNGTGAPAPLFGGSPTLTLAPGAPQFFQLANGYFSVAQNQLSDLNYVEARDNCGNKVPVVVASTVGLRGTSFDPLLGQFTVDPTVGITTTTSVSTASSVTIDFAVGQSSRPFYVISASTGFKNLEEHFTLGFESTWYFGITAVPGNALTGVTLSTAVGGVTASTASIGLGANGVINQVLVNFTLGDPNQSWHVLIATVPYKSGVQPVAIWDRWGFGPPNPGQIAWDGRSNPWVNSGNRVPNGLYYVRVELAGGGVHDDSARVSVALPQFSGTVYDPGITPAVPLSGASLQVYGPSGSFQATTGADGAYNLPGLGAGSYRLNLARADYVTAGIDVTLNGSGAATAFTPRTAGVTVSTNAAGGLDVFLSRAPRLTVVPSLDPTTQPVAQDQWGSLQVQPSTTTGSAQNSLFGPMRLKGGTTTFDDGGQWDPSTQQFVQRTVLSFNVPVGTYTIIATLFGYSQSTASVYVGPDGAQVNLAPFAQKATITGQVFVSPNTNPNPIPISVVAVPLSTATVSSGYGGATLMPGTTNAVYQITGLDAGTYILRANTQGLSAVSSGPITVPAGAALTGVDFAPFGAGASITGTITIGGGVANGTRVDVNAWAPGSFNFGSTSVYTNGGAATYALKGLDAGATYQLFVNLNASGNYDVAGGFPRKDVPPVVDNFTLVPASGVVSGSITLPAGATDFGSVTLFGTVVASLRANDVGNTFTQVATTLPGFLCGNLAAPNGQGYCAAGVNTATFLVSGQNTQTLDISFLYATTGQSVKQRLSIVNGSTATVNVDLRGSTYSISGSILNQISNTLFNTNPQLFANAPYVAPPGWPAALSSTTARVLAIKQDLATFGNAISTTYDPLTSRVGYLDASGNFTISNVPSGVYLVRTPNIPSCATCAVVVPSAGKVVTVAGASVSSVTLTLSDGYSVSGRVALDGGMLDSQVFDVSVLNKRQEVVRSTTVYLGDATAGVTANGVDYTFSALPAGDFYTLKVAGRGNPVKYVGRPLKFPDAALSPNGLQSNLTGQDVTLKFAAYIVGRVKDAAAGVLIDASNATLLAPNFGVTATANPWIEGGYVVAPSSVSGRPIYGDGYFKVGPLIPDQSYDLRLAQTNWDSSYLAQGSQNYAPVTISGLKPTSGEVRDVGVVALGQGLSISGIVKSTTTGLTLGNIKVTAQPSFGGDDTLLVQAYTNNQGQYNLWVSTLVSNQFNVTAAPRDGNQASDGKYYGQVVVRNLNLQTQTSANFLLTPLPVAVTGQIVVADAASGGALSYPFGDKRGFPAAAVNLQLVGTVGSNPLGDIQADTDPQGFFTVPGLSTGIYSLHAASLGYAVFNATVQVTGSSFHIFTGTNTWTNDLPGGVITLARGATVSGRILKSDGTAPNSSEVSGVAAANFAQGEFVVGSVEIDPVAKTVNSYAISGFKTGVSYSIVLLGSRDSISFPPEGAGVAFSAAESTTTKSLTLTYTPPKMNCVGNAKALDAARTQFQATISCSKALRQQFASDDDLTSILTVSTYTEAGTALVAPNGAGSFTSRSLSSDRRTLSATYAIAAGETKFTLRVRAAAAEVDPATGDNFTVDKVFDFYAGLDSHSGAQVTNINGGSVELAPSANDELLGLSERSRIDIPPGAFAEGSDTAADNTVVAGATVTVNVDMTKGTDQQLAKALAVARLGYAPAAVQLPDNPGALPAETYAAMHAYRTQASTTAIGGANPLSSFYSIFLPAGIRHQLKERADLTLSYSLAASTATTEDKINVWFYNAVLGRFVLENTNRRVDPVNQTITVSVSHFSTFVVLDSTPVLTIPATFGGNDIAVANFPNPADCIPHSNIAINSFLFGAGGVHPTFLGTMIRASLPAGPAEATRINIYNVAGEKVRSISQGDLTGGQTYYTPWDCRNNDGGIVSSGVYIGEFVHGNKHKFFKIAIIKGSGL